MAKYLRRESLDCQCDSFCLNDHFVPSLLWSKIIKVWHGNIVFDSEHGVDVAKFLALCCLHSVLLDVWRDHGIVLCPILLFCWKICWNSIYENKPRGCVLLILTVRYALSPSSTSLVQDTLDTNESWAENGMKCYFQRGQVEDSRFSRAPIAHKNAQEHPFSFGTRKFFVLPWRVRARLENLSK